MMQDDVGISIESLSDEVLEFYRNSQMDRAYSSREAIQWTFAGNELPFCVARYEGKVVGLSAYIQSTITLGEQRGTALRAVDSFVSPTMRGKGLFTTLARAYADHARTVAADLVWGFPNDNAAPAWFGKLEWANHGQVPFMVCPLRAGYFLRRLSLPGDFPLSFGRDQGLAPLASIGAWADGLWEEYSAPICCATIRDQAYLEHRLICGPNAGEYRLVADASGTGALVATREAEKHGGRIAYVMEAMGGRVLADVLHSELARLRDRGTELALAWCYPWSPNYLVFRECGFISLPERLRPIRIWFGGQPCSVPGMLADSRENWYLSYLDSDTV